MPETRTVSLAERFPRLAELVGSSEVDAASEGKLPWLWRIERDLDLLARHVGWDRVAAGYRKMLRNGEWWPAAYELRTAALLAPEVERLELKPRAGSGACDLACEMLGHRVFVEVTTRDDVFPFERGKPDEDTPLVARETIERSFRTTTPDPVVPAARDVPASQELRECIRREMRQLPTDRLTVLVLGTPNSLSLDVDCALFGDERLRALGIERVGNGLFAIPDEEGGLSRLSALVWMKLRRHWSDVKVHARLFVNPRAAHPLPPHVEETFRRTFDRVAVLEAELKRLTRVLVEQYAPERLILFGSLAADWPANKVHQGSDIDLAIIKRTPARFLDRLRQVLDLVQPRVGLNVFVYTPDEIAQAERRGPAFIRDEILGKGKTIFPPNG